MEVILGRTFRKQNSSSEQIFKVEKVWSHEEFDSETYDNDIGKLSFLGYRYLLVLRVTPWCCVGTESDVALRQMLIAQRNKHLKSSKSVSLK